MNRIWSWMEECAKGTLKYGPQAVIEFGGGASFARAGLDLARGSSLSDVAGREAASLAFDAAAGSVPGGGLVVGGVIGCLRGTGDLAAAGRVLNRAANDLSAWWGRARHRAWGESEEAIEERLVRLRGVYEKLDDKCRNVLDQFYFERKDLATIAAAMGVTEESVRTIKYRCMMKLRAFRNAIRGEEKEWG